MSVTITMCMHDIIPSLNKIDEICKMHEEMFHPNYQMSMETAARFKQVSQIVTPNTNKISRYGRNFITLINNDLRLKSEEHNKMLVLKVDEITNKFTVVKGQEAERLIVDLPAILPFPGYEDMAQEKNVARIIHILKEQGEDVGSLHGGSEDHILGWARRLGIIRGQSPIQRIADIYYQLQKKARDLDLTLSKEGLLATCSNFPLLNGPVELSRVVDNFDFILTGSLPVDIHEHTVIGAVLYGTLFGFDTSIIQRLVLSQLFKLIRIEPAVVFNALRNCCEDVPFVEDVDQYVPSLKGLLSNIGGGKDGFVYFPEDVEGTLFAPTYSLISKNINIVFDDRQFPSTYTSIFSPMAKVGFLSYNVYPLVFSMLCAMKALSFGPFLDHLYILAPHLPQEVVLDILGRNSDLSQSVAIISQEILEALQQGNLAIFPDNGIREMIEQLIETYGIGFFQTEDSLLNLKRFLYFSRTWFYKLNFSTWVY